MRLMITDLKRGFTEPSFLGVCLLEGAILVLSLLYYMSTAKNGYDGMEAFKVSQSFILPFIAPLLATLPFSNMSMIEEDCGYKRLMQLKEGRQSYDFRRMFTNGLIGGCTFLIPLSILAMVCAEFSPYTNIKEIIGVIILDFCFGFCYASIGYGLTFVNIKRYIPIVAPQVIYLLLIYAFPYLGLDTYYPPLSFSPWILPSKVIGANILLQFMLLMGITISLICLKKAFIYCRQLERKA